MKTKVRKELFFFLLFSQIERGQTVYKKVFSSETSSCPLGMCTGIGGMIEGCLKRSYSCSPGLGLPNKIQGI